MRAEAPGLVRQLTLFDSVMVVISGTIGASIFITPADVLRAVPDPRFALMLWVLAGGITLMASLACAELGAMFPEAGGQYVFIREAYGKFAAFLYGWVLFTAGNSGALAAMAIAFALFFGRAFPAFSSEHVIFAHAIFGVDWTLDRGSLVAVACVVVLTAVNLRSVKLAAWLQNITALAYLGAVAAIVVLGFSFGNGSWSHFSAGPHADMPSVSVKGAGIAMIALLWSYDGWEFLSWVGGEIKNPRRNLPLALILGVLLIIVTYLLANAVFLYALPPDRLAAQPALADAAMSALFSQHVGKWVSLFIAVISFGAASVVVLGGARIYYSMAADGVFFRGMTRIHPKWNTPVTSLLAQCTWVIVLILSGRYEQLYTCFVFMMTLTYLLTVGAVFVLRRTQPDRPRPYRCAGYPWLPAAYMIVALAFVVSTLLGRPRESVAGLALALLGAPLYRHWHNKYTLK
ncbi:MAG: amino acid/polyamine/organocation transporter, superfamily [Gammaproteobacteria bacterium]|nr:amino acid/polyamine/organocation transporter, superfamily [Gammaproteobacteria bacterium]